MSKSVLLCISTLLDGGNHCASASLAVGPSTMGYADSRRPLCCADSKMFNLSDALGRPLFSNIQVCVIFTRVPLACPSDTPYLTPKDQFSLCCVPEDRRARKVRWQTCARMGPSSPHPPVPVRARRCTHKLAEMPRWLSSNKMEIVKGILAGAHTCSRTGPQTPSMYVHNADLSPSLAQMIRPCCMLALFACPPCTSCLTLRAPTQSPRVDGPCLRRHAQGLPVAPGRRLLQPPADWRRLSPIRVRASRQHQCARNSLLSHAHSSDQTG